MLNARNPNRMGKIVKAQGLYSEPPNVQEDSSWMPNVDPAELSQAVREQGTPTEPQQVNPFNFMFKDPEQANKFTQWLTGLFQQQEQAMQQQGAPQQQGQQFTPANFRQDKAAGLYDGTMFGRGGMNPDEENGMSRQFANPGPWARRQLMQRRMTNG